MEDANDRALRSSQAWTDSAPRFLKDYVAESQDAAAATEQVFANAFSGAEDALVGSGRLEFRSLADSILADFGRITVRQTFTTPLAGALQGALSGGGLFGCSTRATLSARVHPQCAMPMLRCSSTRPATTDARRRGCPAGARRDRRLVRLRRPRRRRLRPEPIDLATT